MQCQAAFCSTATKIQRQLSFQKKKKKAAFKNLEGGGARMAGMLKKRASKTAAATVVLLVFKYQTKKVEDVQCQALLLGHSNGFVAQVAVV